MYADCILLVNDLALTLECGTSNLMIAMTITRAA